MSIEVHVRVRPGVASPVWASAETVLYSTANPSTRYVYNKVHPSNSTNQSIFQGIEAIVHAAFDGKNVTVMAYGQTGSGKTHSMIGTEQDAGVVPRTARLLLELKRLHPGTLLQAYYTEIYNESVKDLLEPQRGELALHDAPDGGVAFEKRTVQVEGMDDFLRLQAAAERNRKYGVTNLNDHSSRSHIILTFEIQRPHRAQRSVINLVDLAGSESAARANTEGLSLREGGFINRSLLTLGNVVDAIVEKRPYVPYRDAKLTRILRTCLGGTGITFILCCISPSRDNYEQTITSLRFTQRAMKIKNDPVVVLNMPPLFTHQYGKGASLLMGGMRECAQAEYERGLRDSYVFCSSTAASVVTNFEGQVADSVHALTNAQRLLLAHDHATAMDRVGRLYNQLNEAARQKGKNSEIAEGERKRQRDIAEEVDRRRHKLSRLEEELAEKEAAAETDVAGWEYRLHEARRGQVGEVELLLRTEETRRARVAYEWAVCMERIAARYTVPLSALLLQQRQQQGGGGGSSNCGEEEGEGVETDALYGAPLHGGSKAVVLTEVRERLARARAELADLESAHEMVRDDVEAARRRKGGGDGDGDEAVAPAGDAHRYASEADLAEAIERLEHEERQLKAQAKRRIRQESMRRVRESLRRSSRSPQASVAGRRQQPQPQHIDPFERDVATRGNRCGGRISTSTSPQAARPPPPSSSSSAMSMTASAQAKRRSRSQSGRETLVTRDSYSDGVRNALSVLDGLKNRLVPRKSSLGGYTTTATTAAGGGGTHQQQRRLRSRSTSGNRGQEPTLLAIFGAPARSHAEDKENAYRGGGGGGVKAAAHHHRHGGGGRALPYEVVADDDDAFGSGEPSPGDVTPPIVGIAARRKWDRQSRSSQRPSPPPHAGSSGAAAAAAVERRLYPLQGNPMTPSSGVRRSSPHQPRH